MIRETIHAMIVSRGEQGYGHALVRETLKQAAIPLRAAVKPHNRASRGILENADFRIAGEENGLMGLHAPVTGVLAIGAGGGSRTHMRKNPRRIFVPTAAFAARRRALRDAHIRFAVWTIPSPSPGRTGA